MNKLELEGLFVDMGGVLLLADYARVVRKVSKELAIKRQEVWGLMSQAFVKVYDPNTEEGKTMLYLISNLKEAEHFNYGLVNLIQLARVEHGLLYVITTNSFPGIESKFSKLNPIRRPDVIVNSSDIGVSKPDPEYWNVAFNKANEVRRIRKHRRILVIDDKEENIVSAREAGYSVFHYCDGVKCNEELKVLLGV